MKKLECDIYANNKEWLYNKYIVEQDSVSNIAKLCNVSYDTIKTRLVKFLIPIRTHKESLSLRNKKFKTIQTEELRTKIKISKRTGYTIQCKQCGNDIYINKKSKKKFCSRQCLSNYRKEHYNRNQNWRDWPEYNKWRDLVYFRDSWKCKICNSKSKINVHHIKEGYKFPELRFDVNNGITLCEKHHIQLHKYTSSFIQECIKQTSNIGETPEVDNPEASIREYLYSLIRSNDYQEESRTDYGIVWSATITDEIAETSRND